MKTSHVFLIVAVWLFFGACCGLLIPYYKTSQDDAIAKKTRIEAKSILDAVYAFPSSNQGRFPTNLVELAAILKPVGISDLTGINKKYLYINPDTNTNRLNEWSQLVIVERLGHYPYRQGGFIGTATGTVVFYYLKDYGKIANENRIDLKDLGAIGNRNTMDDGR